MYSPLDSQAIMATIDTALPQLSLGGIRVGTKGQQTAVLQTPLKLRLAAANQGSALRMPFGKPTSYDSSRTADRENVNFSADTQELQAWAAKVDKKIQEAAQEAGLVSGTGLPWFQLWSFAASGGRTTSTGAAST